MSEGGTGSVQGCTEPPAALVAGSAAAALFCQLRQGTVVALRRLLAIEPAEFGRRLRREVDDRAGGRAAFDALGGPQHYNASALPLATGGAGGEVGVGAVLLSLKYRCE